MDGHQLDEYLPLSRNKEREREREQVLGTIYLHMTGN